MQISPNGPEKPNLETMLSEVFPKTETLVVEESVVTEAFWWKKVKKVIYVIFGELCWSIGYVAGSTITCLILAITLAALGKGTKEIWEFVFCSLAIDFCNARFNVKLNFIERGVALLFVLYWLERLQM